MRRHLQQWLPFLIGGVVLAWYLSRVDWPAMGRALLSCNYWWILPIVVFNIASLLLRAMRWRVFLLDTKPVSLYTCYNITAIGFMLNGILPGRVGELIKPFLLKRKEGISFSAALGTCFTERVYDLTAVIVILALSLLVVEIPPNLKATFPRPLDSATASPFSAHLTNLQGTMHDGKIALSGGEITVLGGAALTGRLSEAAGAIGDSGDLHLERAVIEFATGALVVQGTLTGSLQRLDGAGMDPEAVLNGTLTPIATANVILISSWVRNGGFYSGIVCAVFVAAILLLAYAPGFCVSLAAAVLGAMAAAVRAATGRDASGLAAKAVAAAHKFAGALSIFRKPVPFLITLVHTVAIWVCIMMTEYLLFVAFDLHEQAGISGAFLLTGILALSVAAPQLPGFLGVFQVACVVTLAILGIHVAGVPDAYANLLWMVQVLPIIAAGFISLRLEDLSLTQVRKLEVAAGPENQPTVAA